MWMTDEGEEYVVLDCRVLLRPMFSCEVRLRSVEIIGLDGMQILWILNVVRMVVQVSLDDAALLKCIDRC